MLTDVKARNAKPRERDYKLADSGGLYLFVTAKGSRSWRMKYRFGGKEKRLTFGPYPDVSLIEAREKRDAAKRLLRDHIDPATERLKQKLAAAADHAETFETVARRWHAMHKSGICSAKPSLPLACLITLRIRFAAPWCRPFSVRLAIPK